MDFYEPLLVVFLCLFTTSNSTAQEVNISNGLEVKTPNSINVVVESLTSDAREIGLSEKRIRDKVEVMLQKAGIDIISDAEYEQSDYDYYLYANVLVVGDAFNVSIDFKRAVTYSTNKVYATYAAVWHQGGSGTHGSSSGYVVDKIEPFMDSFINDFLKTN